ncbi:MAG TPA: hypothetical protein VME46_21025 [Acidimicrobiales bacterium]|nr:hypothetical protein [Acidimicrobiales bacterium]
MVANLGVSNSLRSRFLPDHSGNLSQHFRTRRWAEFHRRFPELADMSVIDLGGFARDWADASHHPRELLVVNLDEASLPDQPDWVSTITADACELPNELFQRHWDLVYSNSLIEHVGGYWRRAQVAKAIGRLADHHWVQTPARSFPLEPHWVFPFFQFLPVQARAEVAKLWPLSPPQMRTGTLDKNIDDVLWVELVSAAEMQHLYPGSEIYHERFGGITKSIIAIR